MNAKTTIITVLAISFFSTLSLSNVTTQLPSSAAQGFALKHQAKSVEIAERGSGRREQQSQVTTLYDSLST